MPTCYRHPTRETGVACSNCGRPICPDCMTATPVGMRCPECSRQRTRVHRAAIGPVAPVATQAIIAINVIVYLAELATGSGFGSVGGTIYERGALYGPLVEPGGEWWRLVSTGFLHASFFHVAFNMVFVWFIGRSLEPAIGSARFVVAYGASLVCGSFGVLLLEPNSVAVGASGAAFGLLGALLVEARSRGIDLWSTGLLQLALLNFAFTFLFPGIAIGAHLGGFVGGILVGLIYNQADRRRLPRAVSLGAGSALAVVAFVASVAIAGG
ncbi:MAG TPA: rhomboid family intramembrane serine protease [Conexibacter sp.]|jgi:membrane associated rhomboid family serine protease|nr:rhomboid family intramembrane serine protease [Conexibacter sp.]